MGNYIKKIIKISLKDFFAIIKFMNNLKELIKYIKDRGILKNRLIEQALLKIDRKEFVKFFSKNQAYFDRPLSIGFDQTISQPSTVVFMLELLELKSCDNILDIGSGSGWSTALLCKIVKECGSVIGLERVDELVEFGKKNLEKFFKNVNCKIEKANEYLGIKDKKFDKILVSASTYEVPFELFDQLNENGILVIPIQDSIVKFVKKGNKIFAKSFYGFAFVPLIFQKKAKNQRYEIVYE